MKRILKTSVVEIKKIIFNKKLFSFAFIIPLITTLSFGYIYKNEIVREIPVAIIDDDHSALSRKVANFLDASSSIKVHISLSNIREIEKEISNQQVQAVFCIPSDFERNIKKGKNANIVLYKNSQNILINNMLYESAVTTRRTISAGVLIKKMQSDKISKERARFYAMPIKIDIHLLYNSNYSYEYYLVPGFVLFTLQMVILFVSSSSLNTNFEFKNKSSKNENIFSLFMGKMIAGLLIYSFLFLLVILLLSFFSIYYTTNIINSLLFIFLFIFTNMSIGITASHLIKDSLFRTEVLVFINTPAFIFSGYTFPLESMPTFHRILGELMPFTHLLNLFIKLFQMNLSLSFCSKEILILIMTIIFFSLTTLISAKKTVNICNGNQ